VSAWGKAGPLSRTRLSSFCADESCDASSEVHALIGRAQARIALRDAEGAGRISNKAHGLEREDANGLCEYGIVLRARGSLNEAIEVLAARLQSADANDTDYHLAVTLRERDEPGDLAGGERASDPLDLAPECIPAGDFPFALPPPSKRWPHSSATMKPTRCSLDWRRALAGGHALDAAREPSSDPGQIRSGFEVRR